MELSRIFEILWQDYSASNPSVLKIRNLLREAGEPLVNDHIAFRTLDYPEMDIEQVARPFLEGGYVAAGEYTFPDKHLYARHYELPGEASGPRVFISQLLTAECSPFLRSVFSELRQLVDHPEFEEDYLIFSGSLFQELSYSVYTRLRDESEYAAWFYVFGFRANHFTVSINALAKFDTIEKVNDLLKRNGFLLNSSGGEIKGSPSVLLEQSSTMADIVPVQFTEGVFSIPSCYYEFARRYRGRDGKLFGGFNAGSADRIFESTDFYTK